MRCPVCLSHYSLGERRPDLQIDYYPDGERAFWRHCLLEVHQKVLRLQHSDITKMLHDLPVSLSRARRDQKERASDQFQVIKNLLG